MRAALLVLLLAATAACADRSDRGGEGAATVSARPSVPEAERYGGTVVAAGRNDITSMLSFVTSDTESLQHQIHLLFATLVRNAEDLEPQPYLARSWRFDDDSMSVTIDLREDLFWHDGEPVTARDVAFTFDAVRDPSVNYPNASHFDAWEGVEILGEHRLRFTVRRAPYLFFGWGRLAILPAHLLADVPPGQLGTHPFGTTEPVGNGPFRFAERVPGERWVFEANPEFPEELGGRPYIDRYVYRVIPEEVTLAASLLTGDLDLVVEPGPADLPRLARDTTIRLIEHPTREYDFIGWNSRRSMFSEAGVRRALTMAIDRQGLVESLLGGRGEVAAGPVGPWHWAHDSTYRPLPYAPDSSRTVLTAAGWVDRDGDGLREKDGRPFRFTLYSTPRDRWQDAAAAVQRDLAAIGVDMRIETREGAALQPLVLTPDRRFDAVLLGFNQDPNLDERNQWACDMIAAPMQFTSYCNTELDAVMDSLQTPIEREVRKRLVDRYNAIMREDQPYTWLYYPDHVVATSVHLRDVSIDDRGDWVSVTDWWLEPSVRNAAD